MCANVVDGLKSAATLPRMNKVLLVTIALATSFHTIGCGPVDSADESSEATDDDLTKTGASGFFTSYGVPDVGKKGHISNLHLRKDGKFELALSGEFGCDVYAGYHCPSTWSSGRTGNTEVSGSWTATAGGVRLQPEGTGRQSDAIQLSLKTRGSKIEARGTIEPNRPIFADMVTEVRYGKAAYVSASDFNGVWTFVDPTNADGFHPRLDGTGIFVKGYEHIVTFDSAAGTVIEERVPLAGRRERKPKYPPQFWIGGVPSGANPGVLMFQERGGWPEVVRVVSLTQDKMTLRVAEDQLVKLERRR
jgi:hypothetical protein